MSVMEVRRRRAARPDLGLAPAAVLAWVAALGATAVPALAGAVALVCSAGVVAGAAGARRGARWAVPLLLACAFAALAAGHVALAEPARAAASSAVGGRVQVSGVVTTKVEQAWPGAWRFSMTGAGEGTSGEFRATVFVLFTGERPHALDLGATVEVSGRAEPGRVGDAAVIAVRSRSAPSVLAAPSGVLDAAASLRHGFVELAGRFPGDGATLMPGLAVGDTTAVDDRLDAAMKASSLSHLTAVSGSNCAIVVAAAVFLAAWCRLPRWARVVAASSALVGFVVLVTPEASVVRASAMAALAMLCVLLGRSGAGVRLLCLAVVVILAFEPWLAWSIGFVLSVVATGALLLLAAPIAARMERLVGRPIALAVAVPLAAQLACAPVLVLLAPAVSVYGVAANILAAPAAPLATVAGLLACLCAGLPVVGMLAGAVAWVPAQWIAVTATTFAGLPAAQVPWPDGLVGAGALAVVCAAVGVLLTGVRGRRVRIAAGLVVAAALGITGGAAGLRGVVAPLTVPGDWQLAACDIGQGDALVLRSQGAVAVIDTGPDPDALRGCLAKLDVARVDLLVLTHFDADHAGGAAALHGRVGQVVHGPPAGARQRAVVSRLVDAGATAVPGRIGVAGSLGDASWRVLWPRDERASGNDASVVVDVAGGGLPHAVFLGDLSAIGQAGLRGATTLRPPYQVVKVAHHGSADQDERLYAELRGSVALVSVGAGNDYGHPRAETLALLARHGYTVFRTDEAGLVLLHASDDGAVAVWTEREPGSGAAADARAPPSGGERDRGGSPSGAPVGSRPFRRRDRGGALAWGAASRSRQRQRLPRPKPP